MFHLVGIIPFIGNIGPGELLFLAFIALLLFGKRLPEVMRSLGSGVSEFKRGIQGITDASEAIDTETRKTLNEVRQPLPRKDS